MKEYLLKLIIALHNDCNKQIVIAHERNLPTCVLLKFFEAAAIFFEFLKGLLINFTLIV